MLFVHWTINARAKYRKLKAGSFDGPEIRQLINDPAFVDSMSEAERSAQTSFVLLVRNFLGNHKAENYTVLQKNRAP